ncbi:MAG: SprB repeat-containing protein [Saprospiraceae bacterium]|nr:SprB repeat-containing protein [Saprospiraceae bacterium]
MVPGKCTPFTIPVIGDINHDGIVEMIIPCKDNRIRAFTNYQADIPPYMSLLATSEIVLDFTSPNMLLADFDGDGISEVVFNNDVLKFDFSNPSNPSLSRVLNGTGHNGWMGSGSYSKPTAVDILTKLDCNGDPDCDGLELIAGCHIYSIDLDPLDGDPVEIKIQRNLNDMSPDGDDFTDGFSYTADMNLDGTLDVITGGQKGSVSGVYVWDKNGLIHFFPHYGGFSPTYTLSIANVYDDKVNGFQQDLPEIISINIDSMDCFNLNAAIAHPGDPKWWSIPVNDGGFAGSSCFDLNKDGFAEILFRDESYFKILYGGPVPLPLGLGPNRTWYSLGCKSLTGDELPVIANVDNDPEAEIVFTGKKQNDQTQPIGEGRLWVIESDGIPWPPARPIWNQYNYNGVNINDDLTIPKHQQAHHLEFPGLGSGKRPFNTAQSQWSAWDNNFDPLFPVPDAALTVDSTACEGDSLRLWLSLCNHGSNLLPDSLPIAFYQNDPRQAGAVLIGSSLAQTAVPVDACASFSVKIAAVFNAPIFVVANDDGSHPLPYAISNFPITAQPECDFENNFDALVFNHQSPSLDLGPDLSLCSSSVTALNAGAGFSSYRWQDGTTESSFTAFGPGTYWVDVKDACGNPQSDTVHISLNQTATVELGNDLTICEGENIQLNAPGFANVQWSPAAGLSCANCPNPTATPSAGITYYVTAANGNCFASDSIHIFLAPKPVLTLIAQDGDCLNTPQISVSATGTAPLGFSWSNGGTGTAINPNVSGSYTVTVTSGLGCEATATASVMVANSLVVSLQTTPLNCSNGLGEATATASGGTAPFAYNWSNGGNAATVPVTNPGSISVTVTDASGCISSSSATVEIVGQLLLDISSTPISCNDGQGGTANVLSINGTAPFTYNWSNGGTAATVPVTSSGSISVTVTDASGCISSTSATVEIVGLLQSSINITPISCHESHDGEATVQPINGTAPFSWLWANGATGPQLTGLAGGTYSLIVTAANGCTDDLSFTIAAPTALALSISADAVSCFGEMDGAATVVVSGGTPSYQYLWSNFQTTATASQLGQGLQTVTVTDENGCTDTASVFVSEPPLLTAAVQATDPIVCPDSTTTLAAISTGGTPPYTFSWAGGQTDSLLTPVGAGDYTVTVSDENGCTANASVAIQSQELAMLVQDSVVAASSPTASDGSVFVEFSGGQPPFTYLWSNGDTSQNLLSVPAGDYVLSLSDALGCEQTFPFTVDFLNAASQKLGKAWTASILPNPAARNGLARLSIQSEWAQSIDCQIFEVTGKLIWKERIPVSAGDKLYPLNTPNTASVYLVVLSNELDFVCLKWVVMD